MSNQNSNGFYPDERYNTDPEIGRTEQFGAVPQQQYGQPQYQQPQYQQPQYQQQYAQPYAGGYPQQPQPERRGMNGWLIALLVLLVAGIVGALAYLGGTGAFNRSSGPVTSTVVETQTLKGSSAPQAPAPAPAEPAKPSRRTYSNYAPNTSVTSSGFAANVYSAFIDEYNRTGNANITVSAYSPATGQTYRMSCSGAATVLCSGGNNAQVKIW